MAVVIDATVGGTSTNCYVTLAEANDFCEQNIHDTTWTTLTDDQKSAVLVWATRLLDDLMIWKGEKTDANQSLQWPRKYTYYKMSRSLYYENPLIYESADNVIPSDIIPDWLKNATSEFGRLLASSDRTSDPDSAGFKQITVDVLTLKFDKTTIPSTLPRSVRDMVWFYGTYIRKNRNRTLTRL
jgi:hypothetical protein